MRNLDFTQLQSNMMTTKAFAASETFLNESICIEMIFEAIIYT